MEPIPSWTTAEEQECLRKLAAKVEEGKLIVEIGALYGGTTQILAANQAVEVISIDEFSWTPDGYPKAGKKRMLDNLKNIGILNVEVIDKDSREVGKVWKRPIDLLFIDGGHSYEYVYQDLCNFGPKAEVIALHDYGNPFWESIQKAVLDFRADNAEWSIAEVAGTVAVLKKVA